MYKIDQTYINKGIKIKKDIRDIQSKLESLAFKVQDLASLIEGELTDVKIVEDKLQNEAYKSKESFQSEFNPIMLSIEKHIHLLKDVYKPLNDEMESLKKDEMNLKVTIKESYPLMSDDEILKEFNDRINF